jgi:SAM-dependent methyltransferase
LKWQRTVIDTTPAPRETIMDAMSDTNDAKASGWTGGSACGWVDLQEVLDALFEPMQDALLDALAAAPGGRVLDVGCGTGGTTLALARRLGADGDCTGMDISEPMIAAARHRAEQEGLPARFVLADAQRHPFERAAFDLVTSRFGVMFFDDAVTAFANLRRATTDGGALRIIVWRSPEENPFMTTAERAAAPFLDLPARDPDEPGQFFLADERRVRSILEDSGWGDVRIQPFDAVCTFPAGELEPYLTRLGPVGRVLGDTDPTTRADVLAAVLTAFDPFIDGPDVRFTAACWTVDARA